MKAARTWRGREERQRQEESKGGTYQMGWGDVSMRPCTQGMLCIQVHYTRKQQKPGSRAGGVGVKLDTVSHGKREEA